MELTKVEMKVWRNCPFSFLMICGTVLIILERPSWEAASLNSCLEVRKVNRRSDFFRFGFWSRRTRKSSKGSSLD